MAHIPLNEHTGRARRERERNGTLYRIKKAPSPFCPASTRADESVHHYLFDCRAHKHARVALSRKLGCRSKSLKDLLGNQKAMRATLAYVANTRRLHSIFGDVTPIPAQDKL
jgi:hypothetical protein